MSGRPAPVQHPICDPISNRWSGRAIDPKPLARAAVLSLLEAARWAPSCFGDEPWRFLVWDRHDDEPAFEQAASTLVEGNRLWAGQAPVLILVLADTRFGQNDQPNRWGEYDTGAAAENLHIQGVAQGLVVHQMGGFDDAAVRNLFDIPERFTPMAMIAVGHPGKPEDLNENLRARESAPRQRKPLSELAFAGHWGQGLED